MKGLNLFRLAFVAVCTFLGWHMGELIATGAPDVPVNRANLIGGVIGACTALLMVGAEVGFTRKYLGVVTSVIFGLFSGLIMTVIAVQLVFLMPMMETMDDDVHFLVQIGFLIIFSYLGVILVLQSRERFKFIIPFIELQKEESTRNQIALDTSVIIDGRILDLARTGFVSQNLVIPRFILNELHGIADSSDRKKRQRGRRGLEILEKLRKENAIEVEVRDVEIPYEEEVDEKLIRFGKTEKIPILSNDYNLNRVATLEEVEVININDLEEALQTRLVPGEHLEIELVKEGEEPGQGVGFLDDGTMVVVEGGKSHIGEEIHVEVTSAIKTDAGRIIFAEPLTPPEDE